MMLKLMGSVGTNATNQSRDVKIVQILLNIFAAWKTPIGKLKTDGRYGKNTRSAIEAFQKQAVNMTYPDARVDVDGKTFRYLSMYLSDVQQAKVKEAVLSNKPVEPMVDKKTIGKFTGLGHVSVTYKHNLPTSDRIVSQYSINVIKMALKESGMSHAVITSTIREPNEQAAIMYRNAVSDFKEQKRLYGRNGDTVLEVYKANKDKPKAGVIKLMEEKIIELAKAKPRKKLVSKHYVPKDDYLKTNIIDIGVNSTKNVSKNFNTGKFTKALQGLEKEGYIEKFIDETKKSNKAWHIEIKVSSKTQLEPANQSVLSPARWC